jgi:hypothetical protein
MLIVEEREFESARTEHSLSNHKATSEVELIRNAKQQKGYRVDLLSF